MTTTYQPEMTWQSELFASRGSSLTDSLTIAPESGRPRLSPRAAFQELLFERAVLLDIRPSDVRATEGEIAAALHRGRIATPGSRLILLCQDGHASSAAADSLVERGVRTATDIVGGFAAWRSLGLPVGH